MLISSHNSFRVLFDKIASVYFIWQKYIYILALEMASPVNQHSTSCIGTLSFPVAMELLSVWCSYYSLMTFNRWRTVVSATWKYDDPRLSMSHEGAARVWHVQPRVVIFPCLTNYELLRWVVETPSRDFAHYRLSGGRRIFITCQRRSLDMSTHVTRLALDML